jgi:exopolysaccharide biosynthesis polyprenyl glycosylphosphotransferase
MIKALLLISDLVVVTAAYTISLLLRFQGVHNVVWNQWGTLTFLLIIFPLLLYFYGTYNHLLYVQRIRLFFTVIKIVLVELLLYVIIGFATKFDFLIESRMFILSLHAVLFLFFFFTRVVLIPQVLAHYFSRDRNRRFCKYIGPLNDFKKLSSFLNENAVSGLSAFLADKTNGQSLNGHETFVCSEARDFDTLYREITNHGDSPSPLHIVSALFTDLKLNWEWGYFNDAPIFTFHRKTNQKLRDIVRRCIDILFSLAALGILMPLFALIAIAIKLDSRGPVIYKQKRCGRHGKEFTFYKFRSMYERDRKDEKREEEFKHYIEHQLPKGKLINRHDITRVGRVLRKTSFDELPQFINVLKGDMSLIGPRPPIPYEVKHYKKWHKDRLLIKPGISGLWQIYGRGNMPCDSSIFLDLVYVINRSLSLDIKLILKTIPAVLLGKGAY